MDERRRLLDLADVLEQGADTLALFAHHAKHRSQASNETRQTARELAMKLLPEYETQKDRDGLNMRRSRHAASAALLRLATLARTEGAVSIADGAAASLLANELHSAAAKLRMKAAGLE